MKFSELIKDKSKLTETDQQDVSPRPRPHLAPRPPAPPSPKKPPQKEETKLREIFDQEYQDRMRKLELETKNALNHKIQELERQFRRQQEELEKEKQRAVQIQKEVEAQVQEKAKREMEARLQEEYEKLQGKMQSDLHQAKQSVEDLQKKLLNEIEGVRSKEKQLEQTYAERLEKEKKKSEEESPSQTAEPKPIIADASPPPPPPPPPPPTPEPPVEPQVQPVKKAVRTFAHWDDTTLSKAKGLCEEALQAGTKVFEDMSHNRTLDLSDLRSKVTSLARFALKNSSELLAVITEPYQEEDYFAVHSLNCAVISVVLAFDFNYSEDEIVELGLAAFLHDSGLLNVKESLNYPKQLRGHIKKEILTHPERSAELLQGHLSEPALEAIRQHHELCNGQGYPKGLTEKEISPFAKIINLTDAFEAMTHQRPYRKFPLSVSDAVKELIEGGRLLYDRKVLKALMRQVGVYPIMSTVELSNKQIGRVISQNMKFPLSPVVQVEFDEFGRKLKAPQIVDLSENRLVHVIGPVQEGQPYQAHHIGQPSHHRLKKSVFALAFPHVLLLGIIAMIILFLMRL